MSIQKNKLYLLLFIACLAGYAWVFISYFTIDETQTNAFSVCLFKQITHIPCPSCGSTRSILSFLKGNFSDSILWNPIGLILLTIMIFSPIWIAYDMIYKKDSLYKCYHKLEEILRRKPVVITLILLILANWVWNIYKGL